MRIRYLQHAPFETPAAIGEWAEVRGHETGGTMLYADEPQPDAGDFDMLVVVGGPMNVYDHGAHPWLAPEKRLIADAVEAGRTVLGVCLGAQLLADALGAPVTRNPEPEIGWWPVTLTPEGEADPVLGALPGTFTALHWHGDTFAVPEGAALLASSDACAHQAFAYGRRAYGVQFHLECTPESLGGLACAAGDELAAPGRRVTSAEEMLADPERFATSRRLLFDLLDALEAVS